MSNYYELIIRGDNRALIPYLVGYAAASGAPGSFHFATEAGFHLQALRERIKHHGEVSHVICGAAHIRLLRDAIAKAAPHYEFEIKEERKLEGAHFRFELATPNRQVAEEIRRVLAKLPAGVRLVDYAPVEQIDPGAGGAEVYSPAHEYMFLAKGVLEGDVAGIVEVRRALSAIEFTRCDEIDVDHTD